MDSELEKKLRDLLDREAIREVIHRMARGMDRMDNELLLSCYWPEAVDDHNHFVGSAEGFAQYVNGITQAFTHCLHGLLTHNCELAGDDAYTETYYMMNAHGAQPPHFLATGRYVDHFQKRNGEWRILNRVCLVDGQYELVPSSSSRMMPSPYAPGESKPVALDRTDISYQRPLPVRKPR